MPTGGPAARTVRRMDATLGSGAPGATAPDRAELSTALADAAIPPAVVHHRPVVTGLRLSAFGAHRGAAFALGPVTFLAGPSGSGKSQILAAYEALAGLGAGATLEEAFPDPLGRIPDRALPDGQGRRGFRIGCTVDGPAGPSASTSPYRPSPRSGSSGSGSRSAGRSCSPPPCATPAGAPCRPPG